MKAGVPVKRQARFQFVLDELAALRPTVKQMFGLTYIYFNEKLLLALRDSLKQPQYNGVWLFTHSEHIESLRREFPELPKRYFWRSGKNGWVILSASAEDFEEYAFRTCELILKGDQRVGRVTRGSGERTARLSP